MGTEEIGIPSIIETRECGAQAFRLWEQSIMRDANRIHEDGACDRRTKRKFILDGRRSQPFGVLSRRRINYQDITMGDFQEYLLDDEPSDFAIPLALGPDKEDIPEMCDTSETIACSL